MSHRFPILLLALACLLAPFHCAIEAAFAPGACCGSCGHPPEDMDGHDAPGEPCSSCPALESDTVPMSIKTPVAPPLHARIDHQASRGLCAAYRRPQPDPAKAVRMDLPDAQDPPAPAGIAIRPAAPRGPPALV